MNDNRIFGRKRYHRVALIVIVAFVLAMFALYRAYAQTLPQKIKVQFETRNSYVSTNSLVQKIQNEVGDHAVVTPWADQPEFSLAVEFRKLDASKFAYKNPSWVRQTGATVAMVGIQQGGQVLTNGANRAGRAGTVIGTGTSTGSNSASQGVYNKILYDKSKTDIATMKYLLCYRGSCTDEATIVFRIQEDSNSTTRQSRWLLLAYGPAKDKMQPLVGGPADLYEGSGGFTRPDLLQEQLVDLLLLEAKSNRFKLVGASQLAGLLRDVKTAVDRRFGSVVASASIPAVVDSTDVEAERRPAAAAKLGQGEMVPMHREAPQPQAERPRQILDQPPCNPKDAKWDKVKGAFVCPQSAATQSTPPTPRPTPATQFVLQAPPTDGQVGIVAGPFVRAISFLPGASKMKGHDVDLLLALLVNKKYLTWDPTWGRVWGENATAAWQRMEERFKTQGAPLVADGKLTADEFAYWNKVYATYADDFASPEVWQQTPKPAATRRP